MSSTRVLGKCGRHLCWVVVVNNVTIHNIDENASLRGVPIRMLCNSSLTQRFHVCIERATHHTYKFPFNVDEIINFRFISNIKTSHPYTHTTTYSTINSMPLFLCFLRIKLSLSDAQSLPDPISVFSAPPLPSNQ